MPFSYPTPDQANLTKYRTLYLEWFWNRFDYTNWGVQGPKFLFLYSVWGARYASKGEQWLASIIKEGGDEVPAYRQKTWDSIARLAEYVRTRSDGQELFPYLLSAGWLESKWRMLQGQNGGIHGVGPKISAWILRDIAYMRDYHPEIGRSQILFGDRRNALWFGKLPIDERAACIPIDIHVFRGAQQHGVLDPDDFGEDPYCVQGDADVHFNAARKLVEWSDERGIDPRDLDVMWYAAGSGVFEDK